MLQYLFQITCLWLACIIRSPAVGAFGVDNVRVPTILVAVHGGEGALRAAAIFVVSAGYESRKGTGY